MKIEFKQVRENEIYELAELASLIWHEFFPVLLSEEQIDYMVDKFQSERAMKRQIEEENYTYYFIISNGETVGYFGISNFPDYLFLSKLYLKKEYRHKGLGRAAFDIIKEIAGKRNYSKIRLTVNKYNTNTINAYDKYGFKIVDAAETDIGSGFIMDDYIMEYEL